MEKITNLKATDIFSLGLVLYFVITGKGPFELLTKEERLLHDMEDIVKAKCDKISKVEVFSSLVSQMLRNKTEIF